MFHGECINSTYCYYSAYIHLCRSLIIISIILGFFGAVLALVGMKCTKLGGSEIVNARITFSGGINYLLSGTNVQLSSMYLRVWLCEVFDVWIFFLLQVYLLCLLTAGMETKLYLHLWIPTTKQKSEYIFQSLIESDEINVSIFIWYQIWSRLSLMV